MPKNVLKSIQRVGLRRKEKGEEARGGRDEGFYGIVSSRREEGSPSALPEPGSLHRTRKLRLSSHKKENGLTGQQSQGTEEGSPDS